MELNKDNLLFKSNNGLDFYQLVLKDKLVVNNLKSRNIKNPFYNDTKASLSIYFRNGKWLFKDFGNSDYSGDVFLFAAFYYNLDLKIDFSEILKRINQDLQLGLINNKHENGLNNKIKAIIANPKNEVIAYLRSRGITKTKKFYQSNAFNGIPAGVVFLNYNRTGYEIRYLQNDVDENASLPKTKFIGTKQNTVFDATFNHDKERVFICEGVINSLSFAQIGESSIATFGASNIPEPSLISKYIKNKTVYLAGDGDSEGEKFNRAILKVISDNNILVKGIYSIQFMVGEDANDLLIKNALSSFYKLRKICLPLYDYSKVLLGKNYKGKFPIGVFTKSMQNLIIELNQSLNFPVNYSAASFIAAASASIGKTVQIKVQNGWYEQAVVYLILSGRAGINKSHPLTFALKPILRYDEIMKKEFDASYEQFELISELSHKERKELGHECLKEPVLKQILVNDITPESLQSVHSKNPRGLGLYRDEILGWLNSFDGYSASGELQIWLSLWTGTDARTNRAGKKAIYLYKPFVSVFGTIQDARLPDLAKGNLSATGFTDRILFTFSETNTKPYMSDKELPDSYVRYYENIVNKLLNLPLEFNEHQQVQPRILSLSQKAKKQLLQWNKYNADLSNLASTTEHQRSIYAKLDSYIARFTLILQMLHWAEGEADLIEIKQEILEKAIMLTEYYRKNALYAFSLINGIVESPIQISEKQVAKFLQEKKLSIRKIAEIVGKGKSTVGEWLK